MKKLNLYNNKLLKKMQSKPQSSWSTSINGFNINIDSDIPISNLKIFYKKNIPKWISIDLNNDMIHEVEKQATNWPKDSHIDAKKTPTSRTSIARMRK